MVSCFVCVCVRARTRAVLHWVWLPGVDRMYCTDVGDVGGEMSGTTRPLTQCHNPEDMNLHTQLHFQSTVFFDR